MTTLRTLAGRAGIFLVGLALLGADAPRAPQAPQDRPGDPRREQLADLFPRTRGLLGWLEEKDPAALARLLDSTQQATGNASESASEQALAFVEKHHPELGRVLADMRARGNRAFPAAMRDVMRETAMLAQLERRSPETAGAAVEAWRARSRLRLRSAQLALGGRDANGELEALVTSAHEAQRRQLEQRLERLRAQVVHVEQQLQEDPRRAVQQQLDGIRQKIERQRSRR